MIPVICHGCGQTGKVASIPSDLACAACLSTDIDLDDKTAVSLDPSEPMGLLPSGVPDQDADVALLRQNENPRKVVVPEGSAPYTQRAFQTSAAAPIKNCPLCGMKGTVVTQNYGDEKGQHCTYCGAKDADLEMARRAPQPGDIGPSLHDPGKGGWTSSLQTNAAADQRRPEEIALQRELEAKPPSLMTGEEAIDLRRLREQQSGGSDIANPYAGANPYKAARDGDMVTVTYTDQVGIHTVAGRAQVRPSGLMRVAGSIIAPHQIVRLANQDGSADATGHTFTKGEGKTCEVEGCDNAAQGEQKRCEQHTERDQSSSTASLNDKVEQIATAVLASNPGMERKQARKIALKTVGRYPKVAG